MLLVELIGSCSDMVREGVLDLEPLGRDSRAGQYQMLPMTHPGLPVWSYKTIHILWFPLLGLGVQRRGVQGETTPTLESHNSVCP